MADVLMKQMKAEEALVSKEITKIINTALTSKDTISKADEINGSSGGWPYPPTKPMLKLYGKVSETAWKKAKPRYKNFVVTISVNSPGNKPPSATTVAVFDGAWKGGLSKMIKSGDSITSMAKAEYGFECYAEQVFTANEKALGKTCKGLPAGFGLEFPQIWVPNWKKDPKSTLKPITTKKAVMVNLPSMEATIEISSKAAYILPLGPVTVYIDLEGKAPLTAKMKGKMDATFALKAHEAELKKGFGPLEAGFKVHAIKSPEGVLTLNVWNTKIGALKFSGKLDIVKGAFEVALGTKDFDFESKGVTVTGSASLTAKIRFVPTPRFKPIRVKVRTKVRAKSKATEFAVGPKEIAIGVGAAVVIVCGGWIIVGAVAGGSAVGGGTAAGALALAAALQAT